jgi:hypothetical protein
VKRFCWKASGIRLQVSGCSHLGDVWHRAAFLMPETCNLKKVPGRPVSRILL